MRHFARFVALLLLVINACTVCLLLAAAYSPLIQPTVHPVLACFGLAFPIFALINGCFLLFWLCLQRYKSALLPLAALLMCFPQLRTYLPINFSGKTAPQHSCKVLSYNVMGFANGIKEGGKNDILTYLQESDADILCLQEYRTDNQAKRVTQKDVDEALKAYPYKHIGTLGENRSNRMACYSKYPILSATKLTYPSQSNGSIAYELLWGTDTLLLINNHLESNKLTLSDKTIYENMLTDPEKETVKNGLRLLVRKLAEATSIRAPQADTVARKIASSRHPYVIVCGDFNDTPISYTHHTIARHLTDAFTDSGCGLGISYNQNKFYFRIDNILVSKNLRTYHCTVDRSIKASDHYPIWCRLARKDTGTPP